MSVYRAVVSLVVLVGVGCTTSEERFEHRFPASEIDSVHAIVGQGDVSVAGSPSAREVAVTGAAWGRASDAAEADVRRSGNTWTVDGHDGVVSLWSRSAASRAGVDFSVEAPAALDLTLSLDHGDARLSDVRGEHTVVADAITVVGVGGTLDLEATHGDVYGELDLEEGDVVVIYAPWGDVEVSLPWGLQYDLTVWGSPEDTVQVDDLGFQRSQAGAGTFHARSGRGTTRVEVVAPAGSVRVRSDRWW